ncbi:Glutamate receptor 1, partial [Cyphomyrmex costatus]
CSQFSRGVSSMLGAVSPDSFDTLHSYSNTFQMPFVTPWFPEKVLTPSSGLLDFAISMRPDYHRAIIDTVRYYGWKKIIYLYDSHDGKSIPLAAARAFSPPPLRYFSFYYIYQVGSVSRGQLSRYRRRGISSGFPDFCAE